MFGSALRAATVPSSSSSGVSVGSVIWREWMPAASAALFFMPTYM